MDKVERTSRNILWVYMGDMKIPYGVGILLHQPALHPIFSYSVG